jgi:HK97 family phage portal protein
MTIGNLQINWKRKAATPAAGLPYAVVQDGIIYMIGNTPKNYLKQGYMKNPNLFAVINKITGSASRVRFKLFDTSDREFPVEIHDHPVIDLLNHPNPLFSAKEFLEAALAYKLVTGESFIAKQRVPLGANKGRVQWLLPLPPQDVEIIQDADTGVPVAYKYFDGKFKVTFPAEDIIYMRYFNPEGGIRGLSPLCAGREVLAHSNDILRSNRKLTTNMGASGIIQLGDAESEYSEEQVELASKKFDNKYAGPDNYGKLMFLGTKVNYVPIGLKADDLGLHEASKMTMRDICNIYGVSSQLLNDPDNRTYNNVQDARRALVTEVVIPLLELYTSSLNMHLLRDYEKTDGRHYELRVDKQHFEEIREAELALTQTLAAAWWMTLNERRRAMGLEPVKGEEGDRIMMPGSTGVRGRDEI